MTRRQVLLSGAAAMAGCRQRRAPAQVSIVKAERYGQELYQTIRQLLATFRLDVVGKRVLLKPNLVEFDSRTAINTHPLLVHAVFEAFRAMGAAAVDIGEGPGHRRGTWDLAEAAGYFETIPGFETHFTDLNVDAVTEVAIRNPRSTMDSIYLPNTVLSHDLLVSIPKMKTHHWVGATLSMKNLFGVVPGSIYGWPKNRLHYAGIDKCIVDLYRLFPRHFCIVDGIVGMEGNGPIQGKPKQAGVVVAGTDLAAVDATCCRIMGIDPARIAYLREADVAATPIVQLGEPVEAVRNDFRLIPQFESLRLRASG